MSFDYPAHDHEDVDPEDFRSQVLASRKEARETGDDMSRMSASLLTSLFNRMWPERHISDDEEPLT